MSKIVLVTGGSSGIGKSICEHLARHGFTVYGTSRKPSNYPDSTIPLLALDVTSSASISSCIKELQQKEGRIDVLVNNAGIGITGPLEEIPREEMVKNFDTNFFGPVELIQQVLPIMRQQNGGLIINITSIAAYMGLPYRGIYSASKAALEVLTEAIRLETKSFNIKLCNLAPGDFATNIASGRYHAPVKDNSAYKTKYSEILKGINDDVDSGNDPQAVANKVLSIIKSGNPKIHYKVGAFMQKFSVLLKKILPDTWYEKLLANHYKL